MALVYSNNAVPREGYFCIIKDSTKILKNRFSVALNVNGSVLKHPLPNVFHTRDLIAVLKFYSECVGLRTVFNNVTIDMESITTTSEFMDNVTMFSVNSSIGKLYIKKIHNISCCRVRFAVLRSVFACLTCVIFRYYI
jgi:arginine deiminase